MEGTFKCGVCEIEYDMADRKVWLFQENMTICAECIEFVEEDLE